MGGAAKVGQRGRQRVVARLLHARLEQVEGLQEHGREEPRPEAGGEVEGWEGSGGQRGELRWEGEAKVWLGLVGIRWEVRTRLRESLARAIRHVAIVPSTRVGEIWRYEDRSRCFRVQSEVVAQQSMAYPAKSRLREGTSTGLG